MSASDRVLKNSSVELKDLDLKSTTELSEKVQYSRNQAIKNGLNEAILFVNK